MRPRGIHGAVQRGCKRYFKQTEKCTSLFQTLQDADIFPISPLFLKTQRHLYVVIIFKTEGSKEFNFWTDFYFALSAKYLLQRHATHVCFHISISVIIHHQTLTGWKFYHEERKHQGILLFYPKTIIDKINYTNCFPKAPKS